MYVAGTAREAMTTPEVDVDCCLTSLDDVTNATRGVPGDPDPRDKSGAVLLMVAHGVMLALSVTGNAFVLYVIGRHLGYRTATNVYITTLCVADVATAVVCVPLAVGSVTAWRWSLSGATTCVAYDVVRRSLSLLSTAMTAALVVDRYMTVVRQHRVQTVTRRTLTTVAALVTLSLFASLPWYLLVSASSVRSSWSWQWPPLCVRDYVTAAAIYDVVYAAVTTGLLTAGLAFCAALVLKAVVRSTSAVRPSTSGACQLLFQDELRTATTVILLVLVFVACRCVHCALVGLAAWTSLNSAGEVAAARVNSRVLVDSAAALALTVNGAVNPVVYAVRNPNVARVLHLGRQQRYGGYVADEASSTTAHAATTVTTPHRADNGGVPSDCRPGAELPAVTAPVTQDADADGSDAVISSTRMTHVVPIDTRRQQTDVNQPAWSVSFWATRRTSSSFSTPSVIYNVTSRRKSSQSSDRTTSTLTSVVL